MAKSIKANIPEGYCQCGCGERTTVSKWNVPSRGYVAGKPRRFIQGHGLRVIPNPSRPKRIFTADPEIQAKVDALDEATVAWLAGIIDGEGSLHLVRGASKRWVNTIHWYINAKIYGTDRRLFAAIEERIGFGRQSWRAPRRPGYRESGVYWFNATQCRSLLPRIIPWLTIKREQAEILLDVLCHERNRDEAAAIISQLNKKGPKVYG